VGCNTADTFNRGKGGLNNAILAKIRSLLSLNEMPPHFTKKYPLKTLNSAKIIHGPI